MRIPISPGKMPRTLPGVKLFLLQIELNCKTIINFWQLSFLETTHPFFMKDNGTMPLFKVLTLFYNKIDYMYFLAKRICEISFVVSRLNLRNILSNATYPVSKSQHFYIK